LSQIVFILDGATFVWRDISCWIGKTRLQTPGGRCLV